jgi:tetratricopeptide (TPR) repeat protein
MQSLMAISLLALALQGQDSTLARGVRLYEEGNFNEAARVLKKVVEADPKSVSAHIWLGRAYMQQIQTVSFVKKPFQASKAKGEFDKAVALDPRNAEAREARANYMLNAPGIAGGGVDKARAEAIALKEIDPYRGGLLMGRVLERSKDLVSAEAEYRALATQFPDSVQAAAAIASVYQAQQRWSDAFALIDDWLARKPDTPLMQFQLGRAASLSGERLADGQAALEKYLARPNKRVSNDAAAHYRLGMIFERRGDMSGALAQYEAAHRLDPYMEEAEAAIAKLRKR